VKLTMYDLTGADDRHRFSPYCWRTRMACAHKGLALDTIAWRFNEKDKLPQPNTGTVPVLIDGDRVVADSWKIAAYLDERYPDRPLFDSAGARAEALLIKYWTERTLHLLVTRMTVSDIWRALHPRDQPYFRETREKRLGAKLEEVTADREHTRVRFREALEPLRAMLADQPFVCGAAPAFGDYIVFGMFMWARGASRFELLEPGDPVHAWRQRLLDLHGGLASQAPAYPL
jgi:glutathione S-transferase